jgi:hypothetical protein
MYKNKKEQMSIVTYQKFDAAIDPNKEKEHLNRFIWEHLPLNDEQRKLFVQLMRDSTESPPDGNDCPAVSPRIEGP